MINNHIFIISDTLSKAFVNAFICHTIVVIYIHNAVSKGSTMYRPYGITILYNFAKVSEEGNIRFNTSGMTIANVNISQQKTKRINFLYFIDYRENKLLHIIINNYNEYFKKFNT
jgi:hypothetical protein